MSVPVRLLGSPLQTERESNAKRRLLAALTLQIGDEELTIPKGATTNFSSIPWYGRFLVRWSKVDIAGVVHDYLYQTGKKSRKEADDIWRVIAMAGDHRANALQAWIGWAALRLAGGWVWNRYRRSAYVAGEGLQTERLADGRRRLMRDLVVRIDCMDEEVCVPKNSITDFSSIPWFGRVLVRWSKVDIAGVVHDQLYGTHEISRARADEVWRVIAMSGDHRANFLQAWICWAALRVAGSYAWNQGGASAAKERAADDDAAVADDAALSETSPDTPEEPPAPDDPPER